MPAARAIIHVDMDAFYASVEQLDHPEYRGRPLIVGGLGRRGVVATASYEARRFGVRSAMPTAQARRLCPDGIYVTGRMERYAEMSRQVFAVFAEITPEIEGLSLDEAFLDVSASRALHGDIETIGAWIKREVAVRCALNCSVGMAHNKLLAKFASELAKPNGLLRITEARIHNVLDPLPVGRMWTVGEVAAKKLEGVGIRTIGDLRLAPAALLARAVGRHGEALRALANGLDDRPVVVEREDKSIGAENTFEQDVVDLDRAKAHLMRLVERCAGRVRAQGLLGRTVTVKLRAPPFETMTRQTTLAHGTASTGDIFHAAAELLQRWWRERKQPALRLLGVSVSGFDADAAQDDLFAAQTKQSENDGVVDAINARYGGGAIRRGSGLKAKDD